MFLEISFYEKVMCFSPSVKNTLRALFDCCSFRASCLLPLLRLWMGACFCISRLVLAHQSGNTNTLSVHAVVHLHCLAQVKLPRLQLVPLLLLHLVQGLSLCSGISSEKTLGLNSPSHGGPGEPDNSSFGGRQTKLA